MNEITITIPEERYMNLLKNEAKIELMIGLTRRDKYFNRDDFRAIFDPEFKEGEEE